MNSTHATIRALVMAIKDQGIDEIDAAINAVSDSFFPSDRAESLMIESILDGIRWGHRCGVTCELAGRTTLRIRYPGGHAITHEFFGEATPSDMSRAILGGASPASKGPTT
jgi:hypothetical protein